MTDGQMLDVLDKISELDPLITSSYTDDQLLNYLLIAEMSLASGGYEIPEDKLILVMAVKVLSLLSIPENSSLSKKKIKDVEITYFQGQGRSKWDSLLDSLLGNDGGDTSLHYVGI